MLNIVVTKDSRFLTKVVSSLDLLTYFQNGSYQVSNQKPHPQLFLINYLRQVVNDIGLIFVSLLCLCLLSLLPIQPTQFTQNQPFLPR